VLFVSVLFASATTSEKVTEDDDPATPIDTAEGDEMLHMYTISAMPLKTTSASMTFIPVLHTFDTKPAKTRVEVEQAETPSDHVVVDSYILVVVATARHTPRGLVRFSVIPSAETIRFTRHGPSFWLPDRCTIFGILARDKMLVFVEQHFDFFPGRAPAQDRLDPQGCSVLFVFDALELGARPAPAPERLQPHCRVIQNRVLLFFDGIVQPVLSRCVLVTVPNLDPSVPAADAYPLALDALGAALLAALMQLLLGAVRVRQRNVSVVPQHVKVVLAFVDASAVRVDVTAGERHRLECRGLSGDPRWLAVVLPVRCIMLLGAWVPNQRAARPRPRRRGGPGRSSVPYVLPCVLL
jgi:hypothetical protein